MKLNVYSISLFILCSVFGCSQNAEQATDGNSNSSASGDNDDAEYFRRCGDEYGSLKVYDTRQQRNRIFLCAGLPSQQLCAQGAGSCGNVSDKTERPRWNAWKEQYPEAAKDFNLRAYYPNVPPVPKPLIDSSGMQCDEKRACMMAFDANEGLQVVTVCSGTNFLLGGSSAGPVRYSCSGDCKQITYNESNILEGNKIVCVTNGDEKDRWTQSWQKQPLNLFGLIFSPSLVALSP